MNRPVPIPQIPGVPAQLVKTVNNRLLLMQQGASADIAAVSRPTTTGVAGTGSNPIALYANGTLAIQADAAPAVWLYVAIVPKSVVAYVKTAPTGAGISLTIYAGAAWATLTIAIGATQSAAIALPSSLPAGVQIRLAITAVGTTVPGADLSVFVYY